MKGIRKGDTRENYIPSSDTEAVNTVSEYVGRRPPNACKYLFLGIQSQANISFGLWYKDSRMGKDKLNSIIKNQTRMLGIMGEFVPHSLRAQGITDLKNKNVELKDRMTFSGHRSISGAQQYERITEENKLITSKYLQTNSANATNISVTEKHVVKTLGIKRSVSTTLKTSFGGQTTVIKNSRIKVGEKGLPKDMIFENCDLEFQ